jgi:hypothetical protein
MTGLQHSGRKLGRLFTLPTGRTDAARTAAVETENSIVRLLDSNSQTAVSPIQQRLLAVLNRTGAASVSSLVHAVAEDLYAEELRLGAGVLDIGLFGSRLFHNDVVQELRVGDEILWKISRQPDATRRD